MHAVFILRAETLFGLRPKDAKPRRRRPSLEVSLEGQVCEVQREVDEALRSMPEDDYAFEPPARADATGPGPSAPPAEPPQG